MPVFMPKFEAGNIVYDRATQLANRGLHQDRSSAKALNIDLIIFAGRFNYIYFDGCFGGAQLKLHLPNDVFEILFAWLKYIF